MPVNFKRIEGTEDSVGKRRKKEEDLSCMELAELVERKDWERRTEKSVEE